MIEGKTGLLLLETISTLCSCWLAAVQIPKVPLWVSLQIVAWEQLMLDCKSNILNRLLHSQDRRRAKKTYIYDLAKGLFEKLTCNPAWL